jgi:NADH:ubiquinone oxidoreductase subunit B-like Fe-S oxidoreductase
MGQKCFIVIFATGCCKIGVGVCPTACWTFDEAGNFLIVQQLVAQINLMLVSCALNTSWGITVSAGSFTLYLNSVTESVVAPNN